MRNLQKKKLVSCLLIMTIMIGYASFNAIYALTSNELPDFSKCSQGNNDTGSATLTRQVKY